MWTQQKRKVNQLAGGEGWSRLQGEGLPVTGANEVRIRSDDMEFTTELCNEVLRCQSIW